ncbi:MAG: hypothetical protein KDA78_06590 [Planctomycetaceae bacterium]|nr:hypothetical protein [Planctomycetaceae bacterium]
MLADPWKLVAWKSGDWELYDQRVDRVELKNMAGEHPEMVKELSARWERWARSIDVIPFPEDYGVQYLRQGSSGKP